MIQAVWGFNSGALGSFTFKFERSAGITVWFGMFGTLRSSVADAILLVGASRDSRVVAMEGTWNASGVLGLLLLEGSRCAKLLGMALVAAAGTVLLEL